MHHAKYLLAALIVIVSFTDSAGQNSFGIGTNSPNQNAVLDLVSPGNNQGFLLPRLTSAQRTDPTFLGNLGTPDIGLMVFDSDLSEFFFWNGSDWVSMQGGPVVIPVNMTNTDAVPRWDGTDLVDGSITDDGTNVIVTNNLDVGGTITGDGSAINGLTSGQIAGLGTAATLDVGTAANEVVQLDGTGRLPAVDGSQLTNLPGGGNMLQSTYDTDGDGVVNAADDAATVGGLAVQTAVPAGAVFTDEQDLDFTGSQITISGDPTPTTIDLSNYDADVTDDFDGAFGSLTGVPAGLADGDDVGLNTVNVDGTTVLGDGNLTPLAVGNIPVGSITGLGTAATLDVGTAANEVVQLDGTGRLPAVDGSQLTNLPGGGDMLQSTYDTDGDGVVNAADDAATVGGLAVQTAVPAGAVFTDEQDLDFTGSQITISGDPTPTTIDLSNYDADVTDDFDGAFGSLTSVPAGLDIDNTDDVLFTSNPAAGDVSGSYSGGLTVDQVGGATATNIAGTITGFNDVGVQPGTTITDNTTVLTALGELETAVEAGGFTLPFVGSQANASTLFDVDNSGTGNAARFANSGSGNALLVENTTGSVGSNGLLASVPSGFFNGSAATFETIDGGNNDPTVSIFQAGSGSGLLIDKQAAGNSALRIDYNATSGSMIDVFDVNGSGTAVTFMEFRSAGPAVASIRGNGRGVFDAGVTVGNATENDIGTIRWTGSNFEGNTDGTAGGWVPLDASGLTLPFNASQTDASSLFSIENTGTGSAVTFLNSNLSGNAAQLEISNPSSASPALQIDHFGTGAAIFANSSVEVIANRASGNLGLFSNTNTASADPVVGGVSNSVGDAVRGTNFGTGPAGTFIIQNGTSSGIAVDATTDGLGSAGRFSSTNAANTAPVIEINHSGSGNAITANAPIQATEFIGDGSLLTNVGLVSEPNATSLVAGFESGQVLSGGFNTFYGYQAGPAATSSTSNTFVGYQAGQTTSTGSENTFLGGQAGNLNLTGTRNTAVGFNSFQSNSSGADNTAIGYQAGQLNEASQNTFFGSNAGRNNSTGARNTYIGYNSGTVNDTGSDLVMIGLNANVQSDGLVNAIAIGSGAQVGQSNAAVLGSPGAPVDLGLGTIAPAARLHVEEDFPSDNTVENLLEIRRSTTSTTGANGIGSSITIRNQLSNGGLAITGQIINRVTDATAPGTPDADLGFVTLDGGVQTEHFRMTSDGRLTTPARSGNANMLPIALVSADGSGNILSNSLNVSGIVQVGAGEYDISVDSEDFTSLDAYVIHATVQEPGVPGYATVSTSGGTELRINVFDPSGAPQDFGFSVVIYKP